jgi:hypothetical protein
MLNQETDLSTSASRIRWSFLVAVALVVTVVSAACAGDGDVADEPATTTEDSAAATAAAAATTTTTTEDSAAAATTTTEQADTMPDDGGRRNPGGAYGEYGVYERVSFPAGASSATITDAVAQGTVNGYLLGAAAGQFMTVQVTSENRDFFVSFEVYGPDDTLLPDDSVLEDFDALTYTAFFTLPADGDYLVVVQALRGGSPYVLDVEITDAP